MPAARQSLPSAPGCGVEPLDPAMRDAWVKAMTERSDRILASSEKPVETEDFGRGFSEGIVGLLASYELLRLPGSNLRPM